MTTIATELGFTVDAIEPPTTLSAVRTPDFASELPQPSIAEIRDAARGYDVRPVDRPIRGDDPYARWDAVLECGRSYMAGSDCPMDAFIAKYRSTMKGWMQLAYRWAVANPGKALLLTNRAYEWVIYLRGEYVELGLPHQDRGGERHWVTRDGKTRIQVNDD